jgi:hypothetical protein
MKKKSKGGRRAGAGRPKMSDKMETVSIRVKSVDIKKWGGRESLRKKLCDFVAFPSSFNQVAFFDPSKGAIVVRDLSDGEVLPPVQVNLSKAAVASPKPQERPESEALAHSSEHDCQSPETFPMRQIHNGEVKKQIAAIKTEKIPKERDTPIGRKAWALEQKKRIEELEKQLQ